LNGGAKESQKLKKDTLKNTKKLPESKKIEAMRTDRRESRKPRPPGVKKLTGKREEKISTTSK